MQLSVLEILDELNYSHISEKPEDILANHIKKALERRFGKSTIESILEESSLHFEKSEQEILSNYDLFFKVIHQMFGNVGTKLVFKTLNDDLEKSGISIKNLSNEKILNQIKENQVAEFLERLNGHEHILCLYQNENQKDFVISSFLIPDNGPKGLISINKTKLKNILNIQYDKLPENFSGAKKIMTDNINHLLSSNQTNFQLRWCGEHNTWWIERGLINELLDFENQTLSHFFENNNFSCLCCYQQEGILNTNILKKIIVCHNYIIVDNLSYKRGELE